MRQVDVIQYRIEHQFTNLKVEWKPIPAPRRRFLFLFFFLAVIYSIFKTTMAEKEKDKVQHNFTNLFLLHYTLVLQCWFACLQFAAADKSHFLFVFLHPDTLGGCRMHQIML